MTEKQIIERFKKLVNTYCWHVREAMKAKSKIYSKALPFLKEHNLMHYNEIEKAIKRVEKHDKLLQELINEEIFEIINKLGEIEDIKI